MSEKPKWDRIRPLGGGGQSDVFLVRRPDRSVERDQCLARIRTALDGDKREELATAIYAYARPDTEAELGALKIFKIPRDESKQNEATKRLENEIRMLSARASGLPELLDSCLEEGWLVTEFFPEGTLEGHPEKYRGDVHSALRAFRSVVEAAALLHREGYVHRDIKPGNVFIRRASDLVLGDLGIVFIPDAPERLTLTDERVGPRDYMPSWGDLGKRLEKVDPRFDVYMLGKLLWCMVSGRQKLPREWYRRQGFNLSEFFPNAPNIEMINSILDKSVVEDESECLDSGELPKIVDRYLAILRNGGGLASQDSGRSCQVCGEGVYIADASRIIGQSLYDLQTRNAGALYAEYFVCNNCGHMQLFRTKKRVG
jgi:serine/threonine protein kinase